MLIVCFILIALSIISAIIEVYLKKGEKKPSFILSAIFIIGALINGFFWYMGVEVRAPEIVISEDRSGVYFEGQQKGTTTEYFVRVSDTEKVKWTIYKKGQVIPITHDPSTVYYRCSFLKFRSSDTCTMDIHVDAEGAHFMERNPMIKSINASYNEREAEGGNSGNLYSGYTMTERDFEVTGIDRSGDNIHLEDGFTYSPKKLKEGKNVIEIEYVDSEEHHSKSSVTIFAYAPKLLSISAKLRPEYVGQIMIGDTLDTSMFDVVGTYEGGEKKSIDSYSIEPVEMPMEEGFYRVTVTKEEFQQEVNVKVTDPRNISEEEVEGNNTPTEANQVNLNAQYKGHLKSENNENEEDVDYYKFFVKNKGSIKVYFKHSNCGEDSRFWRIDLFGKSEEDTILSAYSQGTTAEMETNSARISEGTYYLKVSPEYKQEDEYTFRVIFEEENDSYETEPNDDIDIATFIEPNVDMPYIGNLTDDEDYDYYTFTLAEKGKVHINFQHDKADNTNYIWELELMDESSEQIARLLSQGVESNLFTNYVRLPSGTYYIRVNSNSWNFPISNKDYRISVEYTEEGDEAESEPNNDYDKATEIQFTQKMTGNIQRDDDKDFYYFYNDSASKDVTVKFLHKKTDNSNYLWRFSLEGDAVGDSIINDEEKSSIIVSGNDAEEILSHWSDIEPGKYYIKVESSSFCNDDYSIVLED